MFGKIGVILVIFFVSLSCKEDDPTGPVIHYPERANYSLVLEVGTADSAVILIARADGSAFTRVPSLHEYSTWPLVSPDRQKIAFRVGYGSLSLSIYDLSTKMIRQVLNERNWDEYAWSPASDRIVFSGEKSPFGFALRLVEITSGNTSSLTDTASGSQRWPHWSPDGSTIVYTHYDSTGAELQAEALYLNENKREKLVTVKGREQTAWSPDTRYLVLRNIVYSWPDMQPRLSLDGVTPGSKIFTKWFPDSRNFLLQSGAPDEGIYKCNVVSGELRKIVDGAIVTGAITVSNDGKLIAYISSSTQNNNFVVMEAGGVNKDSIAFSLPEANYRRIQFIGDVHW